MVVTGTTLVMVVEPRGVPVSMSIALTYFVANAGSLKVATVAPVQERESNKRGHAWTLIEASIDPLRFSGLGKNTHRLCGRD